MFDVERVTNNRLCVHCSRPFQYGDTMSGVVVIQWSESVQTRHDLAYNMTCTVKHPRDITVTSATLGAG